MTERKTFYLENLGCTKNQVDGEAIISRLVDQGWREAESPEDASCIIVNTCGFIEAAKKESLDTALAFRRVYPDKRLIIAGCLSERYGNELFEALPEADGIFGNRDLNRIGDLLDSIPRQGRGILLPEEYGRQPVRGRILSPPGSVYIKAAEGCDNRCTYCSIPLIRGPVRSRPIGEITAEIREFLARETVEFNLLAQDLGDYGRDLTDGGNLASLIRKILEIPGDFRIRLLYIHPEHFPRELISICIADERLMPYFDLPFQHASAHILKAMGRSGLPAENLGLVREIRSALPSAVIRSTFLVGFPGETEEDFEDLLEFQEKAEFEWLGAFSYSPEDDTPAMALHRKRSLKVTRKTAAARKRTVEERQIAVTERRLDRFVGMETGLLVEEIVQGEDLSLARSFIQAPEVDGLIVLHGTAIPPGRMCRAKIIRRNGFDLEAVLMKA